VHAREVHAHEVHTREMHAPMIAREVHDCEPPRIDLSMLLFVLDPILALESAQAK